ncbi:putative bifunctional diguanylate cyclase/phosphodiesterase [Radicibacter daui]|uniref:putative bifunctional diguanylate cyclase/phosphodiesterase n=1 Tax=Radicibacter daui TaxID=3064829 RepID=UPI004046A6B4
MKIDAAAIMAVSQTAIVAMRANGSICAWNPAAEALFGWSEAEALGRPVTLLMPSLMAQQHDRYVQDYLTSHKPHIIGQGRELSARRKDGTLLPIFLTVTEYQQGGEKLFVANMLDLSAVKHAAARELAAESSYEALFETRSLSRLLLSASDMRVLQANGRAADYFAHPIGELIGRPFPELLAGNRQEVTNRLTALTTHEADAIPLRRRFRVRGPERWLDAYVTHAPFNGAVRLLVECIDVTEQELDRQRIAELAFVDQETGLPSRAALLDELARTMPEKGEFTLLLARVGNFGRLALSFGHDEALGVLRTLANRMLYGRPGTRFAARTRENELGFIIEGRVPPLEESRVVTELAADLRNARGIMHPMVRIGAVGSWSLAPGAHNGPARLLGYALTALERSHLKEGLAYDHYDSAFEEQIRHHTRLIGLLSDAIGQGEMSIAYQPVVLAATGKRAGYEALLRWNSAELGPVSPAVFVPVAESSGQILELGEWALRAALTGALASGLAEDEHIAVNVSAVQLERSDLPALVAGILSETGFPASRLELEVTETVALNPGQLVLDRLAALRDMGVRIALDDFGSGYTSLTQLTQTPFDTIKLDRSMVLRAMEGQHYFNVCRGIVQLVQGLGKRVVCEGVETGEMMERITAMGADYAQGYLLGKPGPLPAIQEGKAPGAPDQAPSVSSTSAAQ